MNWHSLLSAVIFLGKGALVAGFLGFLIICYVSQAQKRIAKYKKSGRFIDLLKIFSRY